MKIEQQPKFQPITITLETKEEAKDLVSLLVCTAITGERANLLAERIRGWFKNNAQLDN